MSAESMTSHRHNDYVGGDASKGRIPGAEKATSGHQFNAIFPKSESISIRTSTKTRLACMSQATHLLVALRPNAHRSTSHSPQDAMRLHQAAIALWESTSTPSPREVNSLTPPSRRVHSPSPTDQLQNGQVDEVTHTHPSAQCIQSARTTGQPIELAPAPDSHTVIDRDPYAPRTSAADTLTGATSQDVHNHLGHPGTGQTSSELHHDGQHGRKRAARGADQFGSGAIPREIEQPGEL